MTPEEFVDGLMISVVEENAISYRDLLEKNIKSSDRYWNDSNALFWTLSADQRQVLLNMLRQTAIDTVSNVLGIIDGSSYLDGAGELIELRVGGRDLGGDLQGMFLARVEQGNE
ncbi:hypothetical protein [Roseateles sp. L2-2]|uniref:hypothetical protein n=1 Tax=Roseateles sp. L2-2 TaxID=3422597 RepID=UPI003D35C9F4